MQSNFKEVLFNKQSIPYLFTSVILAVLAFFIGNSIYSQKKLHMFFITLICVGFICLLSFIILLIKYLRDHRAQKELEKHLSKKLSASLWLLGLSLMFSAFYSVKSFQNKVVHSEKLIDQYFEELSKMNELPSTVDNSIFADWDNLALDSVSYSLSPDKKNFYLSYKTSAGLNFKIRGDKQWHLYNNKVINFDWNYIDF